MMAFWENLGRRVIRMLTAFADTIRFAGKVFLRIFQRKTYSSAMREVLVNQIYFTSVEILPVFLLVSISLWFAADRYRFYIAQRFWADRIHWPCPDGIDRYGIVAVFNRFADYAAIGCRDQYGNGCHEGEQGNKNPGNFPHRRHRLSSGAAHHQRNHIHCIAEQSFLHCFTGQRHFVFLADFRNEHRCLYKYFIKFDQFF